MGGPRMEPEVLAAELKAMGCPYPATDHRCADWVEGYLAGTRHGYEGAAKSIGVKLDLPQ